ncbi:Scr1 family TA system antitoxin-like transcriptional regulator [Streptosporangium canum]|uniref:Scr1 family TA system antitoxin-like transcriptional regulator n=1 Tax=Streptosporangium canum TaxID=324952 RepID=UPI003682DCAA
MANRTSPTVRRRRLAAELRRLRQESGKNRDEVAAFVGCAPATITKIENASSTARPADVALLLELYGVTGQQREILMTLAREARQRGWWHQYGGAIPQWFEAYVGLEEEAAEIRSFQPETIDGRLQTEGYIRALIQAEVSVPPDEEIERRVAVRLRRQERLTSPDAPELWVVLGEAALRRVVGGTETMREQLQRLSQVSRLNNVTLQVLPFHAGAHPGMHGGFHLLGFPEEADRAVVYVEYRQGALYLERQPDVDAYAKLFDHLRARALGPDESRALIARMAEEAL